MPSFFDFNTVIGPLVEFDRLSANAFQRPFASALSILEPKLRVVKSNLEIAEVEGVVAARKTLISQESKDLFNALRKLGSINLPILEEKTNEPLIDRVRFARDTAQNINKMRLDLLDASGALNEFMITSESTAPVPCEVTEIIDRLGQLIDLVEPELAENSLPNFNHTISFNRLKPTGVPIETIEDMARLLHSMDSAYPVKLGNRVLESTKIKRIPVGFHFRKDPFSSVDIDYIRNLLDIIEALSPGLCENIYEDLSGKAEIFFAPSAFVMADDLEGKELSAGYISIDKNNFTFFVSLNATPSFELVGSLFHVLTKSVDWLSFTKSNLLLASSLTNMRSESKYAVSIIQSFFKLVKNFSDTPEHLKLSEIAKRRLQPPDPLEIEDTLFKMLHQNLSETTTNEFTDEFIRGLAHMLTTVLAIKQMRGS